MIRHPDVGKSPAEDTAEVPSVDDTPREEEATAQAAGQVKEVPQKARRIEATSRATNGDVDWPFPRFKSSLDAHRSKQRPCT